MSIRLSIASLFLFLSAQNAGATTMAVSFIGLGIVSGTAVDESGLTGTLEDGSPQNRMGGFGSAIAYTGQGHRYLLLPDRGPADGATSYSDRIYLADINVRDGQVQFALKQTVLLKDEQGRQLTGAATALTPVGAHPLRFDPEGARITPDGSVYISEEYGPSLVKVSPDGRIARRITVPHNIQVAHYDANPMGEMPPNNLKGRAPNRGIEGLALSDDGSRAYGIMQSALIQDGVPDGDKMIGHYVRIIEFDLKNGRPLRQFAYELEDKKNSVSEILHINGKQFLVLERDGKSPGETKYKRVYKIDLSHASDISRIAKLPSDDLPRSIRPVSKSLAIDFLDHGLGVPRDQIAEKIEGMAFGPNLEDGSRLLLITSDNDFLVNQPTRIYAFRFMP